MVAACDNTIPHPDHFVSRTIDNVSTAVYNPALDIFQACYLAGQSEVTRSEK